MKKRISESIKQQIREAYRSGIGQTELSRRFDLSIYRINTVLEDVKLQDSTKVDMKQFNKWMKTHADQLERSEALKKITEIFNISLKTAENYYMAWKREFLKNQNVKINMHVVEKDGVIKAEGNNGKYLLKHGDLILYRNGAYLNLGDIKYWEEFKQEVDSMYDYDKRAQGGFKVWK